MENLHKQFFSELAKRERESEIKAPETEIVRDAIEKATIIDNSEMKIPIEFLESIKTVLKALMKKKTEEIQTGKTLEIDFPLIFLIDQKEVEAVAKISLKYDSVEQSATFTIEDLICKE